MLQRANNTNFYYLILFVYHQVIVNDVKKSDLPFCLHFDETSTTQVKKQMDLTLRYWSPTHDEVWVNFYTSLFFGHAEGEKVADRIFQTMVKDGLPITKLCTLVRDGPNVNKTIFRKLEGAIKDGNPDFNGFVDLGSCVLHNIHNAFGKGLEDYGKDVEQMCVDIHSLFKYSAARREDYRTLQIAMGVELHNFQQHTEVRWVSLGPSVRRILEQWECVCSFVKDLGKDPKTAPKSICYKRVAAMLNDEEGKKTKAHLEFISNVSPVFEEFLTIFQKSCPQVHILYDKMSELLRTLMGRFLKREPFEKKFGNDLVSIDCSANNQLPDSDIAIGEATKKALAQLKPERRKNVLLGIRTFYSTSVTYLQSHLPLQNILLKALGCLNPLKREKASSVKAIARLAKKLQPQLDVSIVQDEWRVYSVDEDVEKLEKGQRVDHFWQAVFTCKSLDGTRPRYLALPKVVKSGLVLAQMNAESERSLSVNARIVTLERTLLGERTIVGLRAVKDAVKFHDPEHNRPEKLPLTDSLLTAVRSAHMCYRKRLEEEEAEKKKKEAEKKREAEEEERRKRDQEKLRQENTSLRDRGKRLDREEQEAMEEMQTADELLSDGTVKLQTALSSGFKIDSQAAKVACLMIETAKANQAKAKSKLEAVREKQKEVNKKNQKLLEKALPTSVSAPPSKKRKPN